VYEALRAGASGFLLKDATAAELVHAVRVVAAGDALLAPAVTRRLIADFARQPRPDPPFPATLGALTHRESEVLRLIARGLSNTEISDTLVIAQQTTKTYVGRILAKLDLRDRAQAVVFAYETGLVTPGGSGPAGSTPSMSTPRSVRSVRGAPPGAVEARRNQAVRPGRPAGTPQSGWPPDSAAGTKPALIRPAWLRVVEGWLTQH
jgi:DNA-binding CsgD family transcriptional regulator